MDKTTTISEVMTPHIRTIGQEQTLSFALEHMRNHDIRHLPVLHGGVIQGVVSDRGINLIAGLNGIDPDETSVGDVITTDTLSVTPDSPLKETIDKMISEKIGSAVVVQGKELVGIFTTHDALKVLSKLLS